MSKVLGRLVTCDRCGKTAFSKRTGEVDRDGGFTHYDTFESLKGWGSDRGYDLCPDCFKEWNKLQSDFMSNKGG